MSSIANLRNEIAEAIGILSPSTTTPIEHRILDSTKEDGYTRHLIEYNSSGDQVTAFLLLPEILDNNPAILIHHQHNREHHLGKSEVCGLAGNPLQAFGPELARKGFVVLAPDSICFEDRRKHAHGIEPLPDSGDFWQHYNEMCYRILNGDYLMKKVLNDAMNWITLLSNLTYVDNQRIGTLGHSYGGNTVLFLSALDERIGYSCASGSACTYENRMLHNVGIEMASVIPHFHSKYDIYDLVSCIAPRRLLIVSADEDKYSRDAPTIVEKASPAYSELEALHHLHHKRYQGGHGLTEERFDYIIEWLDSNAKHCEE
ncbi:alpha/beta hydrolase family protein [Paenibacillus tepidiphilus]|uniref:alpha/beta hydrolase family protein n=1 Tax=Paenibacillus tepidiphilus TaxID=2608683 RepID=UPI0013A53E12|nr:prolyl oligopeptidase family serine peptidase [Paenibacillus tepidiphilus]